MTGPEVPAPTPLSIDDIYSPAGFRALLDACMKVMWVKGVNGRTSWFGFPTVQTPEDLVMLADLIYRVRPDIVVECGVFHGGGLAFYGSILELLGHGTVLGVDIAVPAAFHHLPWARRIEFLQGSSIDDGIFRQIAQQCHGKNVLVVLDSDHSRVHVLAELRLYSALIRPGGYLVAMDGVMQILHDVPHGNPSWIGDNPEQAIKTFLLEHPEFERDPHYNRLEITHAPGGFLRRTI